MSGIVLVHWHEAECADRAERLVAMGHDVRAHWQRDDGGALTRAISRQVPDAVVIDLGRLPSHGRAVARYRRIAGSLAPALGRSARAIESDLMTVVVVARWLR